MVVDLPSMHISSMHICESTCDFGTKPHQDLLDDTLERPEHKQDCPYSLWTFTKTNCPSWHKVSAPKKCFLK